VDAPAGDAWAAPPELDPVLFPDGANVKLVRQTGERSEHSGQRAHSTVIKLWR
jgi:hypothetical protein